MDLLFFFFKKKDYTDRIVARKMKKVKFKLEGWVFKIQYVLEINMLTVDQLDLFSLGFVLARQLRSRNTVFICIG